MFLLFDERELVTSTIDDVEYRAQHHATVCLDAYLLDFEQEKRKSDRKWKEKQINARALKSSLY